MKINFALITLGFLSISCERQIAPLSFTFDFAFNFPTEPRPNAIAVDKDTGYIYVSNSHPYRNNDNRKIQKYNHKGEFSKTIVDFTTFNKGNYSRYEPIDMTIGGGQNLYVLVKPYRKHSDDSWWPLTGFCVLNYSFEGDFKQEFDFAQFEEEWSPAAIAYYDGYIFVTNGCIVKRISECNGQSSDISLPINEKNINTWPDIHTTDMAIANGNIWLVGQASFSDNSVGCHITKLDPTCKDRETFYSQGRTNFYGANLNHPGVALDRNGNIFVATCYCKSLEIFNYEGKFLTQIEIGEERSNTTLPFGVAIGRNEDVYILDHAIDIVHVYKVRL